MSDRRITGWVVTLMPSTKAGRREWERDALVEGSAALTADKADRYVWKCHEYSDACESLSRIADDIKLHTSLARLRILPVYAKTS